MNLRLTLIGVMAAIFSLAFALERHAEPRAQDGPVPTAQSPSRSPGNGAGETTRTPVLVELFTSEGCSSCPPADDLVAKLQKTQPVKGAEIIALKEHVDYWNRLGWKDPFSAAQFSERQNYYAEAFGSNGVYTPQMVVDGKTEFVGSAERRAQLAIQRSAQTLKSPVSLQWLQPEAGSKVAMLLEVRIDQLRSATSGDDAQVYLAITEDGLHSDVKSGENAGSRFDHFAVVRDLKLIGNADPSADPVFRAQLPIKIADGWKKQNLRGVVFVQEHKSRRVLGVASTAWP
jgi:hypothetical protein